ncbi:tRNA 2-thiouridine(34) synthase MnmA [Patescibacteria group bacterium]|nr:MAG: tRNA 2-thiouridine(34) synthase MnmA [Patescibacteria group bacterium]
MPGPKPKVLLGMSGGVDSSVAAALLLEQGYEVIGAFMRNWSDCAWRADRRDANRVAAQLGIPFLTLDFEKEYREKVIDEMFREFAAGRTPNPDVLCNRHVKFDLFAREADRLGCDFVATGHYARVQHGTDPTHALSLARGGVARLMRPADTEKDQTYFLWAIEPKVLPRVLFPLAGLTKPEVRAKAKALQLPVADKPDSVGICFVGEVDMKQFLAQRIPHVRGRIVTTDGRDVGTHDGLPFYTIGQREGLGVSASEPYYVVEKRMATNELVVGSAFDPGLFKKTVSANQANWFRRPQAGDRVGARIRHRGPIAPCTVDAVGDATVSITFDEPQRAVTPGQSIVFYDGDEVLGGGVLSS